MANHQRNMENNICLVTGSTSGLGKVTSMELARRGATVALVGRDPEKTERTAEEIRSETGNDHVDWLLADLLSQTSIHQLAQDFRSRYGRLDVLVNNAGASSSNMARPKTVLSGPSP